MPQRHWLRHSAKSPKISWSDHSSDYVSQMFPPSHVPTSLTHSPAINRTGEQWILKDSIWRHAFHTSLPPCVQTQISSKVQYPTLNLGIVNTVLLPYFNKLRRNPCSNTSSLHTPVLKGHVFESNRRTVPTAVVGTPVWSSPGSHAETKDASLAKCQPSLVYTQIHMFIAYGFPTFDICAVPLELDWMVVWAMYKFGIKH